MHVREGSFDSVPVTPVDRLRLAPIPPYKLPHEVKEEPVDAVPEAEDAPRVIDRADFASFFSGFKKLARGVQERIKAAEARAHELVRIKSTNIPKEKKIEWLFILQRRMAMNDLFDSGIDDGAAAGSVENPPSQAVDEEHEVSPLRFHWYRCVRLYRCVQMN